MDWTGLQRVLEGEKRQRGGHSVLARIHRVRRPSELARPCRPAKGPASQQPAANEVAAGLQVTSTAVSQWPLRLCYESQRESSENAACRDAKLAAALHGSSETQDYHAPLLLLSHNSRYLKVLNPRRKGSPR